MKKSKYVAVMTFKLSFNYLCIMKVVLHCKIIYIYSVKPLGHAVAQLVEALRYKPEARMFDSRWCHWNFSLT
jgi:hypothetical protein